MLWLAPKTRSLHWRLCLTTEQTNSHSYVCALAGPIFVWSTSTDATESKGAEGTGIKTLHSALQPLSLEEKKERGGDCFLCHINFHPSSVCLCWEHVCFDRRWGESDNTEIPFNSPVASVDRSFPNHQSVLLFLCFRSKASAWGTWWPRLVSQATFPHVSPPSLPLSWLLIVLSYPFHNKGKTPKKYL